MQPLAKTPPRTDRISLLRTGNWLDVSPEATGAGLGGKVLLCPAAWLICVYSSTSNADRIDSSREIARMQKLLRATAAAWQAKLRVAGENRRSCHFSYEPGIDAQLSRNAEVPQLHGVRLELTTRCNANGNRMTTISLAD
ncbi:MAG: hypothetical protein WDZ63_17085 [Burkholderiales bacterium]